MFNKKKNPQAGPNLTEAEMNELFLGQHNAQEALNYLATVNRHGADRELKKILELASKVSQGKATIQDFRNARKSVALARSAGAAESFVLAIKRMQMKSN